MAPDEPQHLLALADALERSWQGASAPAAAASAADRAAPMASEALHEAATRYFQSREQVLREQSSVASSLLDQLRRRGEGPVQRVLRMSAPAGGEAGGRFLVGNPRPDPVTVRFVPRFALPVRFSQPDDTPLGAWRQLPVDLRLDLADAPFAAGSTATLLVDVELRGSTSAIVETLKLWLDLSLDAP